MLCPRCPFFSGEVPADVCARCSRVRRLADGRALLAAAGLLVLSWVAGHTLTYFFTGSFWTWPFAAFGEAGHSLQLPQDYRFPVDLGAYPAFAVVLGLLYGILSVVPALAACLLGLWVGVVLALASWAWVPHPWFPAVLLAGAVVAGLSWGGARRWLRRLAFGVGLPVAFVVAAHVVSAAKSQQVVDLLPGAVAAAVAAALVGLTYREVYWRSLRVLPVTLATLVVMAASPLLFSLTVTFPAHSYRLLSVRFSVESLSSREAADGLADFDGRRSEAAARFADFAGRYPGSPLAPEALIQEARLLNLRATAAADGRTSVSSVEPPQFFEDRIAPEALPVYASIIKLAPASVAAARARLEQARWSLQNGRFEEARQRYRDVLVTYETHIAPGYEPPADLLLRGVCRRVGHPPGGRATARRPDTASRRDSPLGLSGSDRAKAPSLQFTPEETQVAYYEAYLTARQALAFLAGNGQVEGEPLRLFLRLAPSAADYGQRLEELLLLYPEDVYPDLGLLDDIRVALARGLPDEAQRLTQLLARVPRGDGYGRALYRLAELARARDDSPAAERCLRQLVEGAGKDGGDPLSLEVAWAAALLRQGLAEAPPWPQPFP